MRFGAKSIQKYKNDAKKIHRMLTIARTNGLSQWRSSLQSYANQIRLLYTCLDKQCTLRSRSRNVRQNGVSFMNINVKGRILLVDDDACARLYYEAIFSGAGFLIDVVSNLGEMRDRLTSLTYDNVLLDLNIGAESGIDGLAIVLKDAPYSKVHILTGHGTVPIAVDALQRGASGFFEKGSDIRALIDQLENDPRKSISCDSDLKSIGLIGRSPALMDVVDKIGRLRDVDSMVLVLGESGTGKEVIARAIHSVSKRAGQRFHAVNCGAIPENLLESELFGHTRGAFTDAKTSRKGIFELCSSGTLLLDEIGDMPLPLQMKLLRVLQEHEVTPVGGSTSIKVDTRVIAATHRDILQETRANRFREDLYYRLSIVVLHIPPLRQRVEDIPLLVDHFLETFKKRFNREVLKPCPSLMNKLVNYKWPGNIRELQNAVERAFVLSTNGSLDDNDIFAHLSYNNQSSIDTTPETNSNSDRFGLTLSDAKTDFERSYLEHHLKNCYGKVGAVAKTSGRYRADIYRLLSRHGIDHLEFRG